MKPTDLFQSPFARLLAINLIVWQCIALWIRGLGLAVFSGDDVHRAVLSVAWAGHPFFFTADGYWLPLPFYFYGSWRWLLHGLGGLHWYSPMAALMTGIAATCIGMAGIRLARAGKGGPPPAGLIVLAALAPLMIRDNWRIAAAPLSEPPYLMLFAGAALAIQRIAAGRPHSPRPWIALLGLLVLFQMTRYEAFALSYVAWTAAWAMGRPDGISRRGSTVLLIAGWAALALFPLACMIYSHRIHGHALEFVTTTRRYAESNATLFETPAFSRLKLVVGWMIHQGEALLALALAGIWIARKERGLIPIAVLMLCAFGLNVAMASGNMIGIASPSRFTLGFVWMCIPPAIVVFDRLWTKDRRRRIALLMGLGWVVVWGFRSWSGKAWGGVPVDAKGQEALDALGILARENGWTIVVEDPERFASLNWVRFTSGAEKVATLADFSPARRVDGRFLYIHLKGIHSKGSAIGRRKAADFFAYDVAYLDRMPPDQ